MRIGSGTGFAGDRIEPAVNLAARAELDVLVLECLAERRAGDKGDTSTLSLFPYWDEDLTCWSGRSRLTGFARTSPTTSEARCCATNSRTCAPCSSPAAKP